jgi:hypothetical protein
MATGNKNADGSALDFTAQLGAGGKLSLPLSPGCIPMVLMNPRAAMKYLMLKHDVLCRLQKNTGQLWHIK